MASSNQNNEKPILVTKSIVPPMEEFQAHLNDIWTSRHFTNLGPKHAELEKSLCNFLRTPDCVLMNNGTHTLVAALAPFNFKSGEVVTTPFTFVASAHCLEPLGLKPKFVDIEPDGLTIDPGQVEKAITPDTKAILGVHVYGNPCHIEKLQAIADRHKLKIVYDAAHAFGVTYNGQSIFNYGDASTVSFHATKAFHTFEGGAVFSPHAEICEQARRYRNFGMDGNAVVVQQGLNTKMSEVQAAAGLVNLVHYQRHVENRRMLYERYQSELGGVPGLSFVSFESQQNGNYNYCPVLFERGRDELFDAFKRENILTRKYFHPLLTDMPAYAAYKQDFPVASRIAEQVLCLPIYSDLGIEEQDKVIRIVKNFK